MMQSIPQQPICEMISNKCTHTQTKQSAYGEKFIGSDVRFISSR